MRTVFTNAMVAHVWAQQSQSEGRSGNGQFFFRDSTIYSYGTHFPIARFVNGVAGERAVLFTTRTYSVTTSQHKGDVHHALHGLNYPTFYVERPDVRVGPECIEEYRARFIQALKDASRARKRTAYHLDLARNISAEAIQFAAFFGLTAGEPMWSDDWAGSLARAQEAEAEANEQRRLADEQREIERAKQRQLAIAEWLAGEGRNYFADEQGGAYLRIHGDVVETSRGAVVPVKDARRIFPFIIKCRSEGKSWHRNGKQIQVGEFQLDAIDSQGNIRAGCHLIQWPQIERIAGQLGLIAA